MALIGEEMFEPGQEVTERRMDVNGVSTLLHEGSSGPPVVLLHGSGPGVSAWANWHRLFPSLARQHRVVAPDMLGFGRTERPAGADYNLTSWVGHLLGIFDVLGIERASIIGNSWGGAVTLAFALRHPQRVDRLVLMGSTGANFPLNENLDFAWGLPLTRDNIRRLVRSLVSDEAMVTNELVEERFEAAAPEGVHEAYLKMFPAPRQDRISELAAPEDDLRRMTHETLIIHGKDDKVLPFKETGLRLFELIPNSQFHVFSHCGHWTQVEQQARFERLVLDFLAE